MPDVIGEAFVAIRPDGRQFERETTSAVSSGVKTAAGAAAGLLAGYGIKSFLSGVNDEARESQKVGAQTEAVLKSTAGAANIQADAIGDLATKLSKKAGVDDEVIQSGENMLLTFKNIRNEAGKGNDIFNQTTEAALDMAAGMAAASGGEVDLKGASIQLGKALNDPVKGITALTRVGVTFTQQQKDQIAQMVESGNILGAQKVILKEVMGEFGGSAAAQATDADKATVAIKNFQESIGTILLPVLDKGANALTTVADGFSSLPQPAQEIVTYVTLAGGALVVFAKGAEVIGATKGALSATFTGIADASKKMVGTEGTAGGGSGLLAIGGTAAVWASAAFLIGGTAVGLSRTISGESYKIGVDLRKLSTTTDAELTKVLRTVNKIDPDLVKGSFKAALDADPAQAQRIIDALDRAGIKTGEFQKQLDKVTTAEAQSKEAGDKHAKSIDGQGNSADTASTKLQTYLDKLDKEQTAFDALANKDLANERAQVSLTDSLTGLFYAQIAASEAGGLNVEANRALSDQLLTTKGDVLSAAQATYDSIAAHYGAEAGIDAERQMLVNLAGTMEPGSPLRVYIEQLIGELDNAAKDRKGSISVDTGDALANTLRLIAAQEDYLRLTGGNPAAYYGPPALGIGEGFDAATYLRQKQAAGVYGYASGGWVGGTGSRDTVPAMLTPGEYVMSRDEIAAGGLSKSGPTFHFDVHGDVANPVQWMRAAMVTAHEETIVGSWS